MKLLIMGVQGSGKGTQAKLMADFYQIPHLSTGDLVRGAQGVLKKELDSYMTVGKLVPDELIIKILKEELTKERYNEGFILDGFPRTLPQAFALDKILKIDKVLEIEIPDEEAIKRISTRLSCKTCGSVYNTITNPPKVQNVCDKCNSPIIQREDDKEEAIKKRLDIYHKDTEPILQHYTSIKIDGLQEINKVFEDIKSELK